MSFDNFLYGVKSIVGSRKSRVALDKWFKTTTVGIYAQVFVVCYYAANIMASN
jgi:hypothetical protein